jgi:hypothetical protein
VKVDYSDRSDLIKQLQGIDTVLSFVVTHLDPEGAVQKNLIDASIAAGVRRFAPSEWAMYVMMRKPERAKRVNRADLYQSE